METAVKIDPLNSLVWTQLSLARFTQDRNAEAEHAARRGLELADHGNPAKFYVAIGLLLVGRRAEGIAVLDEVSSALGDSPYGSISAFLAQALQGGGERAARLVTPLLEQSAHWVEYLALYLADGYALIGRRDDALRWLRGAVQQGFINYPFLTRDPFLESLRGEAEFQALMQHVERRWRAFAA
jgi:tetratricopeptide (TPR) repeat protein